ncbi:MAG: DUF465 domain-containing protein [Deltaproteobacteria bacterium]|jgi:uncharacterized protein YdcH (DUF465 family)|nr:DUF465 domain-containing protein [Deltaproteobacteria bacterium]
MEVQDETLIRKLLPENPELKRLMDDHVSLEKRLDELNSLPYLTQEEDEEKRSIQKSKLAGRDRIELIIAPFRN